MQAIETKFVGPTNHRSARICVRCQARTMFASLDHSLVSRGTTTSRQLEWGYSRWIVTSGNAPSLCCVTLPPLVSYARRNG
jgi:hypothetical protein